MPMYCTSCGAELEEGAAFCCACGAPSASAAVRSDAVPDGMAGASADAAASPGAAGAVGVPSQVESEAARTPNRRFVLLISVLAAACLVVAGIGAALWLNAPPPDGASDGADAAGPSPSEGADAKGTEGASASGAAAGSGSPSGSAPDAAAPATADALDMVEHGNGRFGYRFSLPSSFALTQEPTNGAGGEYTDASRDMVVVVWGSNNVLGDTAASNLEKKRAGKNVHYEYAEDNWYVISYEEGGMVYYFKEYVGTGSECGIELKYPVENKPVCDPVLERIVLTFEPGDLSTGGFS